MALQADNEGQKALALELYDRFHAMKTWGKEPESLESIIRIFSKDLAHYPTQHIMQAIKIHSQRINEFPAVSDIIGIIKRKGKPPLSKEMYINISRKDYENRTWQELNYMRDYEAEQQESEWGSDFIDPKKDERLAEENQAQRLQIAKLKNEISKLTQTLHDERVKRGAEKLEPSKQNKIDATVEHMRKTGASNEDIETFMKQAA